MVIYKSFVRKLSGNLLRAYFKMFLSSFCMAFEDDVKRAKHNFASYLRDGYIQKKEFNTIIFDTYSRNHEESLSLARLIYQQKSSYLWVVITSYYSMFYIANAVLYKRGYKLGSKIVHKVTYDAILCLLRSDLQDIFIEEYVLEQSKALALTDAFFEDYKHELHKRSTFQYEFTETIKQAKAQTSLERAERFTIKMKELL